MDQLSSEQMAFLDSVAGEENVNSGPSARDLHCRDFGFHPCSRPAVVVWPHSTEEISKILAWADDELIPITPWGAGTSTEGNPIPVAGGVVLDLTAMDKILNLWTDDMQIQVEPGISYKDMNHKLRHQGLFFPPDPGASATIGGMVANGASGVRTVKYGGTKDYVMGLEMVVPGGQVINTGSRAHKSSSGYDLTRLIVGSEGTLGVVTKATLRLAGRPEHFAAVVASFPSVETATKAVVQVIATGTGPAALEMLTAPVAGVLNRDHKLGLPESPLLLMEFNGFSENSLAEALEMVEDVCRDLDCLAFETGLGREQRDKLWSARHDLAEVIKRAHPGLENLITDAAVPISAYPALIARCQEVLERDKLDGYVFGHAGDGNLHLVWPGDPAQKEHWEKIEKGNQKIVEYAIELGGTATGEHGVGIGKRRYMVQEHGASLEYMRRIKQAFDPKGIMNPGKILP